MKKQITLVLTAESDDEVMLSDSFIEDDLIREINCASNFYEIVSIEMQETE